MTRRIYLAGAIWGVKDPFTWRRDVAVNLPEGWEAVNPLDLGDGIFDENTETPEMVVERDFQAIIECRHVLARIDMPSWGTAMEIRFAKEKEVPVFGWTVGNQRPVGPWLRAHCAVLTHDIHIIFEHLRGLHAEG